MPKLGGSAHRVSPPSYTSTLIAKMPRPDGDETASAATWRGYKNALVVSKLNSTESIGPTEHSPPNLVVGLWSSSWGQCAAARRSSFLLGWFADPTTARYVMELDE
jgi:hypothetical protein